MTASRDAVDVVAEATAPDTGVEAARFEERSTEAKVAVTTTRKARREAVVQVTGARTMMMSRSA